MDEPTVIAYAMFLGALIAPTLTALWNSHLVQKNTDLTEKVAKEAADERADVRDAVIKNIADTAATVKEVRETLIARNKHTDQKLDGIHDMVNSQLTEAVNRLQVAEREIAELRKIIERLERSA